MTISSFHTHTRLCKHASGNPVDYVRQATADGCSALGFSDHCPYPDGTWSASRMTVADVPEYFEMVRAAKAEAAKAAAAFPVFGGFECEWYPAYESWYRDYLLAELGAEFLVYGAHWVSDNGDFWYIAEVDDKRLFRRYIDLSVEGIRTGLYAYMAHPDLFLAGFRHMDAEVTAGCIDIIDAAVGMNMPLEINGLGLQRAKIRGDNGLRSPYPVREFWELAAERGARIICNADAHRPEDVVKSARDAWAFAAEIGVKPEDTAKALAFS